MNSPSQSKITDADGFFVAPFGIDGKLEGLRRWERTSLSPKWIQICGDILRGQGSAFEHKWTGNLSHIRTKFTSAQGAAICTFFANDQVACSVMFLRGHSDAAERDVSKLFVESLRRVSLVGSSAKSSEPFAEALSLTERPLVVVIPFPVESNSDQDHALVRELALHLAAAYLA